MFMVLLYLPSHCEILPISRNECRIVSPTCGLTPQKYIGRPIKQKSEVQLSCSFVESMCLFVVSVCINLSYGIVGITWRSFVLFIVLVAAYCVARAKPCMLCFVMRRPACWSWFFELYCTRRLLRLSTIVIKNIIICSSSSSTRILFMVNKR